MRSLMKSKCKGSGGISNVLVPIPNTKKLLWESVTNAPDIERFVLDRNIHHFSSAGETSLATNKIMDMIGFGGDTEISQQILAWVANVNNITDDKVGQILLKLMNRDTTPISLDFTTVDMMNRYKKWKEQTVTSVVSGHHLAHFHALFSVFEFSDRDDYDNIDDNNNKYLILIPEEKRPKARRTRTE